MKYSHTKEVRYLTSLIFIIGLLIILIGIKVIFLTIPKANELYDIKLHKKESTGIITDIIPSMCQWTRKGKSYRMVPCHHYEYEYEAEHGKIYRKKVTLNYKYVKLELGDKVPVIYSEVNPQNSNFTNLYRLGIVYSAFSLIIGIVLCFVGLIMLISILQKWIKRL